MSQALEWDLFLSKAKIYVIVELWHQFLTQHRSKARPTDYLIPFLNNFRYKKVIPTHVETTFVNFSLFWSMFKISPLAHMDVKFPDLFGYF